MKTLTLRSRDVLAAFALLQMARQELRCPSALAEPIALEIEQYLEAIRANRFPPDRPILGHQLAGDRAIALVLDGD